MKEGVSGEGGKGGRKFGEDVKEGGREGREGGREVGGSLVPRHQNFLHALITLSATSSVCFGTKKCTSWILVMTHNAIYFT